MDVNKSAIYNNPTATTSSASSSSSSTSSSRPQTRGDLSTSSLLIRTLTVGPLSCNCVLLIHPTTKDALLIDPGGDANKIIKLIQDEGANVKQICITHAHFDHYLAAEEVKKYTKAPIALHSADNMLYKALAIQCMMIGYTLPVSTSSNPVSDPEIDLSKTSSVSLPLFDGRVIHNPGHSPGSCSFYFPSASLLCSGDTLFYGSVGRTDLMGGSSSDLVVSIQEKLYELPSETRVIPGHGEFTRYWMGEKA